MTGIAVRESTRAMFPKAPGFGRKFEKYRLKKNLPIRILLVLEILSRKNNILNQYTKPITIGYFSSTCRKLLTK